MPSTISAGTSSGTALNLSGDTTGNLAFQTNGTTTAMTIDTSQNVGIGTTSPSFTTGNGLMVQNGTQANLRLDHFLNGGFEIQSASSTLRFYSTAASTERMRIASDGNVGIGTNNPTEKLSLSGSNCGIRFEEPGGFDWRIKNDGGTLNFSSDDPTAWTTKMSLANNGDLDIGDKKLTQGRWQMTSNGSGGFGGWTLATYNGGFNTAIFVDGNGNTGIGTSSPNYKLQVNNTINFGNVNAGQTGVGAGFVDGSAMFLGADFQDPNSMSGTTNANFKFSTSRTGCIAASNNGTYIYEGFTSASGSRSFAVLSNGNVQNTNNSYGSLSDATIKQDIVDASSQWNDIKNLKVRKYRFIEEVEQNPDAKSQIGLVAQEAETISPGLVDKQIIYKQKLDSDGNTIPDAYGTPEMEVDKELKTIKYSVLYMKAVKALQEAMERIETLEAKVNALEGAK
jgi:hypothetical protein